MPEAKHEITPFPQVRQKSHPLKNGIARFVNQAGNVAGLDFSAQNGTQRESAFSCTSDFFLYKRICYSPRQELNPVPSPDTPAWFLALRWAHSLVLDDSLSVSGSVGRRKWEFSLCAVLQVVLSLRVFSSAWVAGLGTVLLRL